MNVFNNLRQFSCYYYNIYLIKMKEYQLNAIANMTYTWERNDHYGYGLMIPYTLPKIL